ncbi:MAG: GAF domain-containing protein [Lachnospiraceae bacterium]|nr:GAF domain-containing protein [Lachnospiraceae bacterium]
MSQDILKKVLEVGISLSAEKDFNRLLEKILINVMEITNCDAGTLYLLNDSKLHFKIMRNDTLKTYQGGDGKESGLPPVPLTRSSVCALSIIEDKTIVIDDVRNCSEYDLTGPIKYDAITGYYTCSMLVVPMKNRSGEQIGVLQLINAKDENNQVVGFMKEMVPVVESLASEAAIAIQNARYVDEIRGLFQSFVQVMSSAVDERTPYNLTHTTHMAEYGGRFVDYVNKRCRENGKEEAFDAAHKEELLMSIWLHDIGKLVTPLGVMNKDARLRPEQATAIGHRMEKVELWTEIRALKGEISEEEKNEALAEVEKLRNLVAVVDHAGFIRDEIMAELEAAKNATYTDLAGEKHLWFSEEEYTALTIRKGTLSAAERGIMEGHVVVTDKLLSKINFSVDLSHVREWASSHHELLDGSGYPNRLSGDQIPYEVRMITILDIFDALVADDRPYKPGMPIEKALGILTTMAEKEGKLDPQLTRLFIEGRCWEKEAV